MSGLIIFRTMANIFVLMTVRRGGEATRPTDGKIKAARCGAVGWRKSAERSSTSHNVRTDMTVCLCAQVPGQSTLRAHLVHPRHDRRR
jgi:hypothetical protein